MSAVNNIHQVIYAALPVTLIINDMQSAWGHLENTLLQYGVLTIIVATTLLFLVFRRSGKYEINLTYIDIAFIMFSVYLLSNISVDLFTLWNQKTLRVLFLLILFFLFQQVFRNGQKEYMFLLIILIMGITNCIFGFIQFYENYSSPNMALAITGTFNSSSLFSCYTAATLPAFYYFMIVNGKRKLKAWIFIFMVGSVFLLLITFSRAAILSAIIGAIFLINKQYNFLSIQKLLLLAAPVIIVALSLILYFVRADSADGRLLIWRVSLTMWAENPIIGIGTGQFAYRYNDYQAKFFGSHESAFELLASNTYYAFNEYLETLVEGGIVGLLLFILLTVTVFYKFRPLSKTDISLVCCQAGILTLLIFSLFSYSFSSTAIYSLFIVYLSHLSCYSKPIFNFSIKRNRLNVFICIFLVGLLGLGTIGVKRYLAIKEWKKASNMIVYGNAGDSLGIYSKVYPTLKDHGAFLFNYGAELSESERYEESITMLKQATKYFNHIDLYIFLGRNYEKQANYENAEKCYQHASLMIPNRFVPKYLLAKLYMLQGNCVQAKHLANEIITMPVKVDSRTVSLIKQEMQDFLQNQRSRHEGC